MKNVARVDPKTNQLMYNPTYDELYIPKVLSVCIRACVHVVCLHACVCVCVCVCAHVCVHVHVCVCTMCHHVVRKCVIIQYMLCL